MKKNTTSLPENTKLIAADPLAYKPEDDIYNKGERAINTDPDDNTVIKGFEAGVSGNDLDVPGSELDDSDEAIGEEDEENNYYSLGGDIHYEPEESME
jgi:hypothetical protein